MPLTRFIAAEFPQAELPIGVLCRNTVECRDVLFAVLSAGRIVAPLNARDCAQNIENAARKMNLGGILRFGERVPPLSDVKAIDLSDFQMAVDSCSLPIMESKQTALLLCTSGSTGETKIVEHFSAALFGHARAVNVHLGLTSSDTWLCCLPLYHIGGLAILFRAALSGAIVRFASPGNTEEISGELDSGKISMVSLVPTMLRRLLDLRRDRSFHPAVKAIIVGGGFVDPELLLRCPIALPTYGCTEAGSMISCVRISSSERERQSAGVPLPDTIVKIVDEVGQTLAAHLEGEILVSGPGLFSGYRGQPELTKTVMRNGMYCTGDTGFIDDEGNLHVTGRIDLQIKSGGEKIQPAEIERALRSIVGIEDAVVIPINDLQWGQVPGAFVCARSMLLRTEDVREQLLRLLPRRKLPQVILIRDHVPCLENGKPDLRLVRELLERAERH